MQFKLSLVRLLCRRNVLRDQFRCRFASSVAKELKKKIPPPDKSVPAPAAVRLTKELEEYFGAERVLEKFPSNLLKRCAPQTERFYLASPDVAKTVGKFVTDGHNPETLLVEVNPGVGLLTRELLRTAKVDKLMLFEHENWFEDGLQRLLEAKGSGRVQLKFGDFNGHWKLIYLDSLDQGNRMAKLLEGLPRTRWKDEAVSLRLFSIVGTMRFFKTLVYSIANQRGLLDLGRCEMVLALPPLLYTNLTCSKDAGFKLYRSSSVLFQLFFEHQFLGKIPRKAILPWPVNSGANASRKYRTQQSQLGLTGTDEWYVMRIVPRRDLFEYCLPDNLKLLSFFVTQNLVSRRNRIIPSLERWIPYCGARLILNQNYIPTSPQSSEEGSADTATFRPTSSPLRANDFLQRMNIFTEFGELTPSQILTLFNEFINWPEFRQSPFLQTMEQNSTKHPFVRTVVADDEDDDEDGAATTAAVAADEKST